MMLWKLSFFYYCNSLEWATKLSGTQIYHPKHAAKGTQDIDCSNYFNILEPTSAQLCNPIQHWIMKLCASVTRTLVNHTIIMFNQTTTNTIEKDSRRLQECEEDVQSHGDFIAIALKKTTSFCRRQSQIDFPAELYNTKFYTES